MSVTTVGMFRLRTASGGVIKRFFADPIRRQSPFQAHAPVLYPAGRVALADPLSRGDLVVDLGAEGIDITSATFGSSSEVRFDSVGVPYDDSTALTAPGTVTVTSGSATATISVGNGTGWIAIE